MVEYPSRGAQNFTYDALGNRLSATGIGGQWRYNANNELLAYGVASFDYDANGNRRREQTPTYTREYVYSVDDRLLEVGDGQGGTVARYGYDPVGRRLWKEVDGARRYFVYSDEGLIGEYDAVGNELKAYGYAPTSPWGTDPLFLKSGGQYYWYQNDHLGTPQRLVTASGRVVWAAFSDAFGNTTVTISEVQSNLRFPGQYYDAETGLHCNWHRHYDPLAGRYLQTDPLGEGLNHYAYVFNNPLRLIDPLGLCAVKEFHLGPEYFVPSDLFIITPFLVGGASIISGAWVGASGAILTGISFISIPGTYGLSSIGVPIGITLVAMGEYQIMFGTTTIINHLNNSFDFNIPSLSNYSGLFPSYPPGNYDNNRLENKELYDWEKTLQDGF